MTGVVHQLRGMPGFFSYNGPETVDLEKSGSKNQELEIGLVEISRMERANELFRMVPIERSESSGWNCQSWSHTALEYLRREGFVSGDYTDEMIKYWLQEDE
jgi:hypothetical protein